MGEVYRAYDTRLERIVAIKVLPAEKLADEGRKRRFLKEARSASALNHADDLLARSTARTTERSASPCWPHVDSKYNHRNCRARKARGNGTVDLITAQEILGLALRS